MKKLNLLLIGLVFSMTVYSQGPPPPPPSEHGQTGDQRSGGGAPIGSGLTILLGLGIIYAGKKVYKLKAEQLEE